jgi:hypothetical protein
MIVDASFTSMANAIEYMKVHTNKIILVDERRATPEALRKKNYNKIQEQIKQSVALEPKTEVEE